MNTSLPTITFRANALLKDRFDRYASEVRTLLAKTERRGWVKESAAARAELARLDERASLPEEFSTFGDIARLQAALSRDVTILRRPAIVRRTKSPTIAERGSFPTTLNLCTKNW